MTDFWELLVLVIVGAASGLGAIIIWVLNQMASRAAANREPKRRLYEELFQSVFILSSLDNSNEDHTKALWVLDRAWLYASRRVLQANMDFLERYTKIRDAGDPNILPRNDKQLEEMIHDIYVAMRQDIVPKPWYTLGLFEFPKIRGRLEFYQWSMYSYDGLKSSDQIGTDQAKQQGFLAAIATHPGVEIWYVQREYRDWRPRW